MSFFSRWKKEPPKAEEPLDPILAKIEQAARDGASRLDLSNNQLSELPAEITQLTNLSELYLSGNQLSELPAEIAQLTNLSQLYLSNNQLSIPPEILNEGRLNPSAIFEFLAESQPVSQVHSPLQVRRPLNEAKMLLVGQGGVGKTSLVKQLLGDGFDRQELKTEGIAIRPWKVPVNGHNVKLNVWDFGGQEIMHATHQFFLTKRSLYLLVLNARQDEYDNRIEY